jgi:ParB family chromosome partitioning protein
VHQKWRALTQIPAYVRTANDQQMLEMALIENIQRENLNAIEVALSFQRMIDECSLKQEELGDRVSKNRSTVTNYLRLLKLPPTIQASLRDGVISWAMPKLYWRLMTQPFSFTYISKL